MRKKLVFSLLCMLCMTSVALSGVQTVKNITCSLPGTWYYVNSQFKLDATGSADIQTYDAATGYYNYAIENLAVTISPCNLKQDKSSSGWAKGDFWGGGVLTMTGNLMRANNGAAYGDVLYSGTILQASMNLSSSQVWTLNELSPSASIVSATLGMTGTNGGFNSGITFDTNKMIIGAMSLKLQFTTPGIATFASGEYQSAAAPVVQISAALPEPATMMLLALGGLLISKRK
jgi:hypothetical protein